MMSPTNRRVPAHVCGFGLLFMLSVLTGCIPFPHTSEKFPAMRGHVVDEITGQPLAGVVVAVHDHPRTIAKTDASGVFYFSKYRNYHVGMTIGMCGTSWPTGSEWSDLIDLAHPAYEPRQVDASKQIIPSSPPYDCDKPCELRPISLKPKP